MMMTDGRMSCQYGAVDGAPHAAKSSNFYNYYFPMTTSSRQLYDNYSTVSAYHPQAAPQRYAALIPKGVSILTK